MPLQTPVASQVIEIGEDTGPFGCDRFGFGVKSLALFRFCECPAQQPVLIRGHLPGPRAELCGVGHTVTHTLRGPHPL